MRKGTRAAGLVSVVKHVQSSTSSLSASGDVFTWLSLTSVHADSSGSTPNLFWAIIFRVKHRSPRAKHGILKSFSVCRYLWYFCNSGKNFCRGNITKHWHAKHPEIPLPSNLCPRYKQGPNQPSETDNPTPISDSGYSSASRSTSVSHTRLVTRLQELSFLWIDAMFYCEAVY
jgi:hypothetical protein